MRKDSTTAKRRSRRVTRLENQLEETLLNLPAAANYLKEIDTSVQALMHNVLALRDEVGNEGKQYLQRVTALGHFFNLLLAGNLQMYAFHFSAALLRLIAGSGRSAEEREAVLNGLLTALDNAMVQARDLGSAPLMAEMMDHFTEIYAAPFTSVGAETARVKKELTRHRNALGVLLH